MPQEHVLRRLSREELMTGAIVVDDLCDTLGDTEDLAVADCGS